MSPLIWNKTLPLLVLPLGASLLLLLLALRFPKRSLVLTGILVLWICGTPVIASALLHSLERRYPDRRIAQYPEANAIVVLGGIISVRKCPQGQFIEWKSGVNRFETALDLYFHHRSGLIVFSGVRKLNLTESEGDYLRGVAIQRGVPANAIFVTQTVNNTAAEAAAAKEIGRRLGWSHILLVTSAFHMPRAMLLFRRDGFQVTPVPVDFEPYDPDPNGAVSLQAFLPDGAALAGSERALREYLGLIFYTLRR